MQTSTFLFIWWQWLIIIAGLTGAISFLIWFIIRTAKGRLKIGNVELNSKTDSANTEKRKSPHTTCPNNMDLGHILKNLLEVTIQIHDIRTRGILASQMMKTEEYLLTMKDKCLAWFSQKLGEQLKVQNIHLPPIHHTDYLHYRLAIHEFMIRVKDLLRAACINNGFTSMDDARYKAYVKEMIDRIGGFSVHFFDENYIGEVILQEQLRSYEELYKEMGTLLANLFDVLRTIAHDREKEITVLLEKRKAIVDEDIGVSFL